MPTIMGWKLGGELKQFLIVTLYMYVCFLALLLFTMASGGAHMALHAGTALLKAMLLAKFVLLSQWLHVGDHKRNWRGIYSVLFQALAMWIFLILLTVIERVIETLVRGESVPAAFAAAFQGDALVAVLAHSLILFLVLLPYVAFRQVGAALAPGELNRIFFKPRA